MVDRRLYQRSRTLLNLHQISQRKELTTLHLYVATTMPTPVVTPHDVRLYSKDQLSSSPGPSRLSNHASSTSRHHPTTAHNYSETRPPSPRQHCAPLVGAARKFPGSPTISRRGTPSRSQTSTVTTASSSGRATMASWDAGRRDGDETPILGATGPNGVGTTVRARRVPEGAGASELPDDSGRIRVAVRVSDLAA